ncbi:MAG TPA: N-acetyltransferase [Rhodanobacteraceae bacterium]|nr:N-acetyltransferase [Rhodanobacteraceae bacterium]
MPRSPATTMVRIATRADLDALLALERATFASDRISRAQWRRHLASNTAAVLVCGGPGQIDATAVVCYRRNARSARLYSLAVSARARGAGLGSALLAAAETDARTRGCDSIHLEVQVGNRAAIALYEQRGYLRGTRLPHFYEDGADAWRYQKPLMAVPD